MKTTIKSIVIFTISVAVLSIFTRCQEEEIEPNEPTCSCYEVHEQLEPVNVNGMPVMQWVIQYETTPANMPCSSETEYTSVNNSQRWRVVCQ